MKAGRGKSGYSFEAKIESIKGGKSQVSFSEFHTFRVNETLLVKKED